MQFFPITIIDNFLPDPDKIRKIALEETYYRNRYGTVNGERSASLAQIHPEIHDMLVDRLLSLFYDDKSTYAEFVVRSFFHKNTPYHNGVNWGWVHRDKPIAVLGGLIYLTPDAELETGTNIYRLKRTEKHPTYDSVNDYAHEIGDKANAAKKSFYREAAFIHEPNADDSNPEDFKYWYEKWHECFEETVSIKNVYNRMILFDGDVMHSAGKFSEERLSLVFFVTEVNSETTPLLRMKINDK